MMAFVPNLFNSSGAKYVFHNCYLSIFQCSAWRNLVLLDFMDETYLFGKMF